MSGGPKKRRRLRLFWRIYLNGVLLLFIVALAVGAVVLAFGDRPAWTEAPTRLATLLADDIMAGQQDQARFQRRLDELHHLTQVDLAVFTPEGVLLASAGDKLDPLGFRERADLLAEPKDCAHHLRRHTWAAPIGPPGDRRGLLLFDLPRPHKPGTLLALVLAIGAALALATWPLARAMARPLERLTGTARALASGDLEARTGMDRSDEVGLLADTMDRMADELVARLRGERELLANVSHELRTPLARLKVALELAEDDSQDPQALAERLAGMAGDVVELDALVENVLLAARLDPTGNRPAGLPVSKQTIDPTDVLTEAQARFERYHPEHSLKVQIPDGLPSLEADPVLLRRVIDNLLSNAAKAAPVDQPIELEARLDDNHLSIFVRDRGPGVPEADLPKLFDAFFRSEPGRERSRGGVGLGLTLCKRIVQAHGGEIQAELRKAGGLEVSFHLPTTT